MSRGLDRRFAAERSRRGDRGDGSTGLERDETDSRKQSGRRLTARRPRTDPCPNPSTSLPATAAVASWPGFFPSRGGRRSQAFESGAFFGKVRRSYGRARAVSSIGRPIFTEEQRGWV